MLLGKPLKLNWFFLLERIFFTKILNQEYFLFTIYHMIYRHTSNKVHHMWQLLISFKWKINLVYFKINILFHTPISETISNSNVTMAATSLSTIELISFNNAIFSAINGIRHILKQRADINPVLNEIKKIRNLKTLLQDTCRTIWIK